MAPHLSADDAGADPSVFISAERAMMEIWIEGSEHFDVGVKVYATMFVKHLESTHIGDKCKVASGVCLAGIVAEVDVEVIFVPFDDVVVGHNRFPGGYICLNTFRFWLSAKPAIVDGFGNHGRRGCYR